MILVSLKDKLSASRAMDKCMIFLIIATPSVTHGREGHKKITELEYQFRLSTDSDFSQGNSKNLFIQNEKLTLYCQLYDSSADPLWEANLIVEQYKLQGVAPTVSISNQTWSTHFRYPIIKRKNMDYKAKLNVRIPYWMKEIDHTVLGFGGLDAMVKEQWKVTVTMDIGKVIFRTQFTLLDVTTEPLLRHSLSPHPLQQSPVTSDVEDIIVSQSLCVANIAVVTVKRPPSTDIYVGLTTEGFVPKSVQWFALAASTFCSAAGHSCSSLKVLDLVLTNYRVVILTDHGLFYSEETHTTIPGTMLAFHVMWKSAGCDIIESGKVTFSGICQGRHHDIFRDDVVCVAYQCKNKETFGAYSRDNIESWEPVPEVDNTSLSSVVHNYHTDTLNMLYTRPNGTAVLEVVQLKDGVKANYAFPPFEFPVEAAITGLIIHPVSCLYYAFGKQLWLSEDGGNWFDMMYRLTGDTIKQVTVGLMDGVILAQTTNKPSKLLYSKAGVNRVAMLSVTGVSNCTVYTDSFSDTYCLMSNHELTAVKLDINHLIKEFKAQSDHPLVLQMFSPTDVSFYEFSSDPAAKSFFHYSNIGQQISNGLKESSIIEHLTFAPDCGGFLACIHVKLIKPYHLEDYDDSPALFCDIEVKDIGSGGEAILQLSDGHGGVCWKGRWHVSDVYKTILMSRHTSFLITQYRNTSHVLAIAVMPGQRDIKLPYRHWHMIHFGLDQTTGQSVWHLSEGDCHHKFEVGDRNGHKTLFELDINEKINLINIVSIAEHVIGLSETLLYVTLSNPQLFHTESNLDTHTVPVYSQNLSFSIHSTIRVKGMTVVRVQLPMASLLCSRTSRLLTVFAGCPTLKRLVYRQPIHISEEDFLHGNPVDENNNPLLQTLPPNYRPPSEEGVNIPLTDNIYNADPSIPRPTNIIHRSQDSGKYKQCAGKAAREACRCTDAMRYSPTVNDSDCRERVYRLYFPGVLKPELLVLQLGRQERKLEKNVPVSITEVNGRDPDISSMKSPMLQMVISGKFAHEGVFHNPETLKLVMKVYVHSAPLAYPWQFIVNFIVTLLVGLLLGASYLYYLTKTEGLVNYRHLSEPPQKGLYPPWRLAQVEKEKAEAAEVN